jgi:hypothetical protein
MGIGNPLADTTTHPRDDADIGADGATAQDQCPVPEGVFNALQNPTELADLLLRDAASLDGQIDDLRDGEEPNGHRYQPDPIPQEELAKGIALHARDGIHPDGAEQQTQPSRDHAFDDGTAAQRGHEGDA